ncbi:Aurora kinase [Durusdinium trenchii]|uniref:Choline transporter-like protein n=1 Tax=Durusdinium trenchii TaxID=1381693 RepID=A0ABP0H878_9DINO
MMWRLMVPFLIAAATGLLLSLGRLAALGVSLAALMWQTVPFVDLGAIRPFRAVLGSLTAVARLEGNPVGSILNCCCGCFVDIYEQYFEKFSVNAYIEVAVSAMNLDHAAFEASEVCERQKGTASSLNGTTFIFQLVGLTLVWWAGYFVMWMIVSGSCPGLRQYGDVYSPHYVGHQGFWSNAGGIIALTAAFPAMMVFDVVSDTILYCVMVDVMQNEILGTTICVYIYIYSTWVHLWLTSCFISLT